MKKYELTTNTEMVLERKLFQIKALVSFGDIKAGDLGGWIEKEENLSQSDNAWVYGDARVSGSASVSGNARVYGNARVSDNASVSDDARVYGSARVSGDAWVSGNADHLVIGPIGSRKDYTTFYRRKDGVTMVVCGCFHDTIDAFEVQVAKTHGDNEHAVAYRAAVQFARAVMNTEPVEEDTDAEL